MNVDEDNNNIIITVNFSHMAELGPMVRCTAEKRRFLRDQNSPRFGSG